MKESNVTNGVSSELNIAATTREDSGRYFCLASNAFGRDDMTIHLYIQEPPDFPRNLHAIEKGSRFVKLGWIISQDGNSPITQYNVEYKTESDVWLEQNTVRSSVPAHQAMKHVAGLRPATTYQFRLFAENELGRSRASDILDVITDGEPPGGAPRKIHVEAVSSEELHVSWDAPERELWNGDIIGYHVGVKEERPSSEQQYQYKTVERRQSQGGEYVLRGLKKFTRYNIVVQAYNTLGPGPLSEQVIALTLEDVPSSPPQDIRCTPFTSQSLQVSWEAPLDSQVHGILKGYKVIYESLESDEASTKPDVKMTTSVSVVIHALHKYANYSVQVLAFTRIGDGVASAPLFCLTKEDVPEAPADIKAVVSSPTSIMLSWLPPSRSNGVLLTYNLYVKVLGSSRQEVKIVKRSLPPQSTYYDADNLNKRGQYELSVAAVTKVGEGPRSGSIVLSPATEVRAAIYSFGINNTVPWKQDTKLPCRYVGKPEASVIWKYSGQPLKLSSRNKILPDGGLLIKDLRRDDDGNYSCHVENKYGVDGISHRLIVQVPPSAPLLHATASTTSTISLQWKPGDDGGAVVRGFMLRYRRVDIGDHGADWEELKVSRLEGSYVLSSLLCGSRYQIYIMAYNHIGTGDSSELVVKSTVGGPPGSIDIERLLLINSTAVTLHLENWNDGGCTIIYFEVEYKRREESQWTSVPTNAEQQRAFVIKNLSPRTQYRLRVKANNNAGSSTSEYKFQTLTEFGGIVILGENDSARDKSFFADWYFIVPVFISALSVFVAVLAVYFCVRKRINFLPSGSVGGDHSSLHDSQAVASDNKHNLEQREQYYATIRKPLRSPVREMNTLERIPEYSEDICPYATFELNGPAVDSRCTSEAPMQTFVYHDSRLSATETLQIRECDSDHYSKSKRIRRKSRSFKSESEEYDTLGSDSDTEQGTSSRTESSNHLDDPGPSRDRSGSQPFQRRPRIHNSMLHGPESSTSTEPSPLFERKSFPRRGRSKMLQLASNSFEAAASRASGLSRESSSYIFPSKLEPPSGFSQSIELSEAECDLDVLRNLRFPKREHRPSVRSSGSKRPRAGSNPQDFTIAV